MTTLEHTPGPWNHDKTFPTSVWANDIWIASTNVEAVRTLEEKTANARLIAAAPDLLEAPKAVLPELNELPTHAYHRLAPIVHAAVSKAEARNG